MKNILKLTTLSLIFSLYFCKAQQEYPLNTSSRSIQTNSYFKDTNNVLDAYIGTWTANFQGSNIKLVINKVIKRPYKAWNKDFYRDVLIVRYEVKNSAGQIIQSTLSNNYNVGDDVGNLIMSVVTNLNSINEINLLYAGGNCSVGLGDVLFKKIDATHFSWSYFPGSTVLYDTLCPPNLDYNIYLPETENLIFTKQ